MKNERAKRSNVILNEERSDEVKDLAFEQDAPDVVPLAQDDTIKKRGTRRSLAMLLEK